ncbi:aminotransferase class V-fold PLP-dependent enzyme [Mycobacterium sp.]|uniref:aminotransferase class V-fold PLP-dependent enzyme n=1 Tax=Mycobacterium sp. TaxID=1785 RepID=UPI003BAE2FA8
MTQSTDATKSGLISPPYPPLYTPFKFITLRLAAKLRDSRLSSNAVTVTWAILLVTAAAELALRRTVLTFALVLVAILLDCLDGDLARCRRQPSRSGTLLEQLSHWIGNMSLTVAAGAAVLLADPRPRNILLVSTLVVVQSVYIAVIRQVRPDAADIKGYVRLRHAFRVIVKIQWVCSPIELPMVCAFVLLGVTPTVIFAITATLAAFALVVFVLHFILIRAADRELWAKATGGSSEPLSEMPTDRAEAILGRLPEARWWTPGSPKLPAEVLALLARQPLAPGAPMLTTAWRELVELLPKIFRTAGRVIPLGCPEELGMQAVIGTFCAPADQILIVGRPATIKRWRNVAECLGVGVVHLEVPFGAGLEPSSLQEMVARHPSLRAVCLALAEADDGALTDLAAMAPTLREVAVLVVVDACLGLCADNLSMDEWGVDIVVSSSRSGIMAPPGVSLIAMGPEALAAVGERPPESACAKTYLDLRAQLATTDHPLLQLPAPALGGLSLSVQMILGAGLDAVLAHHQRIAERFRRGCVQDAGLVPLAAYPSAACTAAVLPDDVDLAQLQANLFNSTRMVVASGSTPEGATTLQFGHAGWLFDDDVDEAVNALRAAVRACRSAHLGPARRLL